MTVAREHPTVNYTLNTGIPELDTNPLLAHLKLPPDTDMEAFITLGMRPEFDIGDRALPTAIRRLKIQNLKNFYAPVHAVHREALIGISTQVFSSYMSRNPLTAAGQRVLMGSPVDQGSRTTISFISGHSGMGKSTLVDRILASFGYQVCQHTVFEGRSFPEKQILWLRRNIPEHCTIKTLSASFGNYTDSVLGVKLYSGLFQSVKTADRNFFINEIRKIIATHHVGLLVFDEFQNLSLMGVGAEKVIAFLVALRDELGIPILIVGTYSALRLLERSLSSARRLAEGGYYDLERPLSAWDASWVDLCKIAWPYQWVKKPIEFSEEIPETLYEVSQGITGIMLTTFATAQLAAMQMGTECVNTKLIKEVYNSRMKPVHPAVNALKSGKAAQLANFDDLYQRANIQPLHDSANTDYMVAKSKASEITQDRKPAVPSQNKIALSESQIKKMVTADAVSDILSAFDDI